MSEATPRQKAALWVGLVFLLGAALGGVLGYVFAHRSYAAAPPALSDQAKKQQKVERLTQELSLSDDQRQQVQDHSQKHRPTDRRSPAERARTHPRDFDAGAEAQIRSVPPENR
jgi:Spy/CpxP family protein refolding chaperone